MTDTGMEGRETETPVVDLEQQKGPLSDEGAVPHA